MADQDNNQQRNMAPVDPFTMLMWGPPPGAPPFMPQMPQQNFQPQQNQTQGQQGAATGNTGNTAMPNFFNPNGGFDFNKLMDGADKMFKLINQTQPMIKQLGPLLNLFKQ